MFARKHCHHHWEARICDLSCSNLAQFQGFVYRLHTDDYKPLSPSPPCLSELQICKSNCLLDIFSLMSSVHSNIICLRYNSQFLLSLASSSSNLYHLSKSYCYPFSCLISKQPRSETYSCFSCLPQPHIRHFSRFCWYTSRQILIISLSVTSVTCLI